MRTRFCKAIGMAALCLAAVSQFVGCNRGGNTPSGATTPTGPRITAEPNPVPAGGEKGVTTISWDTADGSLGYVAFAINNGEEKSWFSKRPKGSHEVNWINKGGVYEFRLYDDKDRAKLLASVKVTRASESGIGK